LQKQTKPSAAADDERERVVELDELEKERYRILCILTYYY
jgi:hypothetical protein